MNNIKGNIPAYVMTGVSVILSLVTYIYMTTTSSLANQQQQTATALQAINDRTTILETNYLNIKDSLTEIKTLIKSK